MAKEKKSEGVDVEGIFSKLTGLESEAAEGIESLLKEKTKILEDAEKAAGEIQVKIDTLNNIYRIATGEDHPKAKPKPTPKAGKGGGTRVRRGDDELKADAEALYNAVKAAGKAGASKKDIEKAAPGIDYSGKLIEFIEKHIGKTITKEGKLKSTRYFA